MDTSPIPKIIHQLWIGPKPMPSKFMDTWRDKHPDFEYIRWTEKECVDRGMQFRCTDAIQSMTEINGQADIMRWEILYKYGGVFIDADSFCIEPLDSIVINKNVNGFAGFEHESLRPGLVATGTMGFYPQHPLCADAIDWILKNDVSVEGTGMRAWKTVGPGLLTRMLQTNYTRYPRFIVYPSYFFLPVHHSGVTYEGHGKVYAYQEWGSTKLNYDTMNQIILPNHLYSPSPDLDKGENVSVLISSYNTKKEYIRECLNSILNQQGHFGIEIIWIDDGSTEFCSADLKTELSNFIKCARFIRVKYKKVKRKIAVGGGSIGHCMNVALSLASYEIVVKMDSDDVMLPHRIQTQLNFMKSHDDCVLCGSQVGLMYPSTNNTRYEIRGHTKHPASLTWAEFQETKNLWFMNNPTLCFRKSAILSVGGYDEHPDATEDWLMEIHVLKKYGVVYNIDEVLLYYRIHEDQVTFHGKFNTAERVRYKGKILATLLRG